MQTELAPHMLAPLANLILTFKVRGNGQTVNNGGRRQGGRRVKRNDLTQGGKFSKGRARLSGD